MITRLRVADHGLRILTIFLIGLSAACEPESDSKTTRETARPTVYTTFYPTQYFTERIAGNLVDVRCPVPADADALFWKPDTQTIQELQAADLIVLNGANLEKWIDTVTLPKHRIVDTTAGLSAEFIEMEKTTHSHGPAGDHSHEGTDSHTWIDPINAIAQARAIEVALVKHFPTHASRFRSGAAALLSDLESLDAILRELGKPARPLLASHPAYNYVGRRYGWELINLDLDPEVLPQDEVLADIRRKSEKNQATHILWESAPASDVARALENIGLTNVEFSPCELPENSSPDQNYLSVMRENLERLRPAFK